MLPLSRLIIRLALPHTLPLITRLTFTSGVAAAIHHQTLYSLCLVLFRTIKHGVQFLNISFVHDLLPKNFKIDLISLRRVIISAIIAKLFRYLALATFWIPFRGAILEILLNQLAGDTSTVKSILGVLNQITLPWLQELNNILVWTLNHVQPIAEWHISIAWIPAIIGLTTLASYFYWYPETDFTRDMSTILGSVWTIFNVVTFGLPNKVVGLFVWSFGGVYNFIVTPVFNIFHSIYQWFRGTNVGLPVNLDGGLAAPNIEIPELPDPTTAGT